MLVILISWIYIAAIVYTLGVASHAFLRTIFRLEWNEPHFSVTCLTGMAAVTFFAMLCCLFMPLGGFLFQGILLILAAMSGFLCSDSLRKAWKADRQRLSGTNWIAGILFIAFAVILAKLSYQVSSHHDDGLYYSTTIKWLQEYGTVKGVANLNPRIAFNSSWHILQAAFSFPFLHLGLFNDLNGLIMALLFLYSIGGMLAMSKGRISVLTAMRGFLMLPVLAFHFGASSDILLFNVNFISSSSADIPACLLTWITFLLLLEGSATTSPDKTIAPTDILVILYSVWVLTIKLSCAPIAIFIVFILARMLFLRRIGTALFACILCAAFVAPWIYRNALLSGYLIFPFASLDLLHVPWKLPMIDARWFQNAIKAYVLGVNPASPVNIPFSTWFPKWFAGLVFIQQVVLSTAALSFLTFTGIALRHILLRDRQFFIRRQRPGVFVLTGTAGILFWLLEGPDFRFGYGFLCIYILFFLVLVFRFFLGGYSRYLVYPALLYTCALFLFYYKNTWESPSDYFAAPIQPRMPIEIRQINIPSGQPGKVLPLNIVTHDDSWNAPLPAANDYEYRVLLPAYLGTTIKEGFRSQNQRDRGPTFSFRTPE